MLITCLIINGYKKGNGDDCIDLFSPKTIIRKATLRGLERAMTKFCASLMKFSKQSLHRCLSRLC